MACRAHPPADLPVDDLASVVRREWRLAVGRLDDVPEGGGAYHWVARATDGRRWFVTCDDLDTKPSLGTDRDAVFAGLRAAYGAAIGLPPAGAARGSETVTTHGEPHPGNLIRTHDGFALVDWDTVAAARPERDLWMLDDSTGEARAAYQHLSGRALDPLALDAHGLLWALT